MKACISCTHFSIDFGCQGYSSMTPGESATASCAINKHRFDLDYVGEKYLRKNLVEIAEACDGYELSDDAKAMGWPAE